MRGRRLVAVAMLATLATAGSAHADEAALRKRIEELEEQQRQFNQQLQELRQQLEHEQAPAAAPAVAAPPPLAPAPAVAPAAVPAAPAPNAAPVQAAEPQRVDEVERRQGILTDEIRKIREFLVLPETQELKGYYGLGPAASKVYGIPRGLSIGGYGEANVSLITENAEGNSDTADLERFVTYIGYKFNEHFVLNSEIEFEHATSQGSVSSGNGDVEVEFLTLDYLYQPAANARGGLMLLPMGFINEVHEPPFYFGNTRPPVETQIIPTTWRAIGAGIFGQIVPGLDYKAYGLTSLNAKGYTTFNLRNARQNGNQERASDWSFVARADYLARPWWTAGGSFYLGDQGQNEEYGNEDIGFRKVGVFTQIYEIHTQVLTHGFWFRALGTTVLVDDAGILSQDDFIEQQTKGEPIGKVWLGAYAETAYDVLPLLWPATTQYLAPWFRYSWLDTNNKVAAGFTRDPAARRYFYEFGLQYKPIPQIVLKADYHIQHAEQGALPSFVQLGGGFVF
jgi:hypothetical protein